MRSGSDFFIMFYSEYKNIFIRAFRGSGKTIIG